MKCRLGFSSSFENLLATLFFLCFCPGRDTQGFTSLPHGQVIASTFESELQSLDVGFNLAGALACDSIVLASCEPLHIASPIFTRLCSLLIWMSLARWTLNSLISSTDLAINWTFAAIDVFFQQCLVIHSILAEAWVMEVPRKCFPACWLSLSSLSLSPLQVGAFTQLGLHRMHSIHPSTPVTHQGHNGLLWNGPLATPRKAKPRSVELPFHFHPDVAATFSSRFPSSRRHACCVLLIRSHSRKLVSCISKAL